MAEKEISWTTPAGLRAWGVLAWAYGSVALVAAVAEAASHPVVYGIAVVFIAARQHTLYVLNHDASHGNLFSAPRTNRWFANFFCVWPFLHHPEAFSFELWRRIHVLHHKFLFRSGDPNYVGRERRGDTARPPTFWILAKNLVTAPLEAIWGFLFGQQDYVGPLGYGPEVVRRVSHQGLFWRSWRQDRDLERERWGKWAFFLASIAVVYWQPSWGRILALYWLVPMYAVYPAILRWMDLTEHNWADPSGKLEHQANSRRGNLVYSLFLSDLSRHLHWEHHSNPRVPFHRLPAYSRQVRLHVTDTPAELRRGFLIWP